MAKIPNSAKKKIARKCQICERKFISKEFLVTHISKEHSELIPAGWSASRYENYLRTGKTEGHCVVCGSSTEWNESTWKYARLCKNKKCRESISKEADKNMVSKYGKTTLLNDAEQQRKMIYSKKTSGIYYWSTDTEKKYKMYYASSVEKKFLEMLDAFLDLEPEDVMSPSPNNYTYEYEGTSHLYIPDVYIVSLNLEIELKEPSNNQNKHPKIQAVDKVKEKLKDELMDSIDYVNYIKINGSDYREFFEYFAHLKQNGSDYNKSVTSAIVSECNTISFDDNELNRLMEEIMQEPIMEKRMDTDDFLRISATVVSSLDDVINPELDYKRTLTKYSNDIDNCKSLSAAGTIRKNMTSYKRYLKTVINDKNKQNLHYEARRALDRLKVLEDKLDLTIRDLKKMGGQYFVTEGYDASTWYQVTESQVEGIKNGEKYKPVFIVLSYTGSTMAKIIKGFTKGTYSHASISLDTKMNRMCSFNAHGFVDEDLSTKDFSNEEGKYAIYMYMAPQVEYMTMEHVINQFTEHRSSLKYSTVGLFNYITGKETTFDNQWFCSEFVSYVLNQANPKLFKKHYSLYSPDDLTQTRKFTKVASGNTLEYDYHEVDRTIRKILNRKGYQDVKIK